MALISKIFGDPNERFVKKLQPLVEKINQFETELGRLSDTELKAKTSALKESLEKGQTLDDILSEAFALVREAAKRTLGQRHFDVQLIGGIVLHQGKIAEMKTGEGKTLAATLSVYLNGLMGKGVHIVTVNDYLAKRDAVWMGQIYQVLGLSVGCIVHENAFLYEPDYRDQVQNANLKSQNENSKLKIDERDKKRDTVGGFKVIESYLRPVSRKEAYLADITYGTNNEFGFDYLRDNMVYDLNQQVQRGFHYAILDEIDSILIDEARTPLIISSPDIEATKMYDEFARIIPQLEEKDDYEIDEKMRAVTLTEPGIEKIEKILGLGNIYEEKGIKYVHHLEQALRAETLFKRDRDYVVKDGQVIIVDEFTGRLLPGRRYSGGLHQALEAKERVRVQPESMTLATITFQNYFRIYKKLAGMTGTALTSAEEFDKVYGLEVIVVPTNKPMIRKDLPDRIYKTEKAKFEAVVRAVKERHQKGQPVLVGTRAIERNEYLGKLFEREGISHQILNAKHHEREGEIIAQAGKLRGVTLATNMAGRGVDIMLGGTAPSKLKSQISNLKSDKEEELINPEYWVWEEERDRVVALSGLHIIGTERHEARRIDNQLRGRSGRQGDPGSSQFFISLEDELMRIFGGERVKVLMEKLKMPDDQPIEAGIISKVVEAAQSRIEGMNFDLRKHVLEYDDVMNKHREVIYKKRKEILEKSEVRSPKSEDNLRTYILEIIKKQGFSDKEYEQKEQEVGEGNMRQIEKVVALRVIDSLWLEHLDNMEHLRDSVRLRAYGQQDPLVEYKREGHQMFQRLLNSMEASIAQTILKVKIERVGRTSTQEPSLPPPSKSFYNKTKVGRPNSAEGGTGARFTQRVKIGRNDPCPCGATHPDGRPMKYKHCHGR